MAGQGIDGYNELSQLGDIAGFYRLIRNCNIKILEQIDELPFVHTPLHTSASDGQIEFSIEMMKLKPSFISKQNEDGHTPIYLALLNGHSKLVRQLLQHNVDLVRVKGRECMTPLHDAATNIGREDPHQARNNDYLALLENFLSVCPDSITNVTSRNETALHIAAKHNNLEAFKFLVGWVLRKCPDWKKILEQKDVDGNTILHIAASKNHTLIVDHILGLSATYFNVNERNLDGETALDIQGREAQGQGAHGQDIINMRRELERAGARSALALPPVTSSHEHYLSLPGICERKKIVFIGNQFRKRISDEKRNALLVVAALLVTVTYQAILSPPGGLGQDAGSATARGTFAFLIFMAFNSIIFLSSIATMAALVPPEEVVGANLLAGVSVSLCFGYFSSLMIITQASDQLARYVLISPLIVIIFGAALWLVWKFREGGE